MNPTSVMNAINKFKAIIVMIAVQIITASVNIVYKMAVSYEMTPAVIIAYRLIYATAFMTPIALIIERNTRPQMTWTVLMQAFLCGLLGASLSQNLYLESIALTSATYASALANLVPVITFILVIAFGLENLNLGSAAGKAKVIGTVIAFGGAMVLTFYKGVDITPWSTHMNLLHRIQSQDKNKILGTFLALAAFIAQAIWLIIQAQMTQAYPCPLSSTALMSLMGSIQAVIYAMFIETNWDQWKLCWDIKLAIVSYLGIVASSVSVTLVTWCTRTKGPLFVSSFRPLTVVIVAVAASLVLDEKIHLGSVLVGVLIIVGIYMVQWGKWKETNLQQLNHGQSSIEIPAVMDEECNTAESTISTESAPSVHSQNDSGSVYQG